MRNGQYKNVIRKVKSTKGDGSCAFHAALGTWNARTLQFEVENVCAKREQAADFIRHSQSTPGFCFVRAGIVELVMNNEIIGTQFQRLRKLYEEHLAMSEAITKSKQLHLESELKKHTYIVDKIRDYFEQNNPTILQSDLYTQYCSYVSKKDDLVPLINTASNDLVEAYRQHQTPNPEMDWDLLLNNQTLLNEYACFFANPIQFLLPCEVAIIAYVFNITIDFYNTDMAREPACYNQGSNNGVSVYFNGSDHYERVVKEELSYELTDKLQEKKDRLLEEREQYLKIELKRISAIAEKSEPPLSLDDEAKYIAKEKDLQQQIASIRAEIDELVNVDNTSSISREDLDSQCDAFKSEATWTALHNEGDKKGNAQKMASGLSEVKIALDKEKTKAKSKSDTLRSLKNENSERKKTREEKRAKIVEKEKIIAECTNKLAELESTRSTFKSQGLNIESEIEKRKKALIALSEKHADDLAKKGRIQIKLCSYSSSNGMGNPETETSFVEVNGKKLVFENSDSELIANYNEKELADRYKWPRGIYFACIDSRNGAVCFKKYFDTCGYYWTAIDLKKAIDEQSKNKNLILVLISADESTFLDGIPMEEKCKVRDPLLKSLEDIGSYQWRGLNYRNPWYFITGPGIENGAQEDRILFDDKRIGVTLSKTVLSCAPGIPITAQYEAEKSKIENELANLENTISIKTKLIETECEIEEFKLIIESAKNDIQLSEKESDEIKQQIASNDNNIEFYELLYAQSEKKIKALQKQIDVGSDETPEGAETNSQFSLDQLAGWIGELQKTILKCKDRLFSMQTDSTNRAKKSELENELVNFEVKVTNLKHLFDKERSAYEKKLAANGVIKIKLSSCAHPWGMDNFETAPAFIECTNESGVQQRIQFPTQTVNNDRQRGIYYVCIDSRNGKVNFNDCFDTHGNFHQAEALADAIDQHHENKHLIHALVSVDDSTHLAGIDKTEECEVRDSLIASLKKIGSEKWGSIGYRDRWYFVTGSDIDTKEKIALCEQGVEAAYPPLTIEVQSNVPTGYINLSFDVQKCALKQTYETLENAFSPIYESAMKLLGLPELQKSLEYKRLELKEIQAKLANRAIQVGEDNVVLLSNEQIKQKERLQVIEAEQSQIRAQKEMSSTRKLELFSLLASAEDKVVRTYNKHNATPAEAFVALLLESITSKISPADFQQHVDAILKPISCKDKIALRHPDYTEILSAVNREFSNDEILPLRVVLHEDSDHTGNGKDPIIQIGEATDQSRQVIIYHRYGHYHLMIPAAHYYRHTTIHAADFFSELMLKGDILKLLCQYQIISICCKEMKTASVENLLDAQKVGLEAIQKDKGFSDFYNRLLRNISDESEIQIAAKIIARMSEFEKSLPIEEAENYFYRFRNQFIEEYKSTIQAEFRSQRDAEDRLSQNDVIKKLNQEIDKILSDIDDTRSELDVINKKLASEDASVKKSILHVVELKTSYEKQLEKIKDAIGSLETKCAEKEAILIDMQKNAAQKDEKVVVVQKQIEADQASRQLLLVEQRNLIKKRDSITHELLELNKRKLVIASEISKANIEKESAHAALDLAKKRKNRINLLLSFIGNVQKIIKNNESVFKEKREMLREKIALLANDGKKSFVELYDYLIAQPELAELASNDVKEAADDAGVYFDDCLAAMKEVVQESKIIFDFDSETAMITMKVSGYNVSWNESLRALVSYINIQLQTLGLSLDSNNKLIIVNEQLIKKLSDFPKSNKLSDLILSEIRTKNDPDRYQIQGDIPKWAAENDPKKIKACIENASFEFKDIVSAFVEGIEIAAGNNIYVERDITLPGIDVALFAEGKICLKPGCQIDTSGKNAPQFNIKGRDGGGKKARDGNEQRDNDNKPDGRHGDNGLCGFHGLDAGDILISAKESIENIDTLSCAANGGSGADGQQGGDGDQGREGKDSDNANPVDIEDPRWYEYERDMQKTVLETALEPKMSGDGGFGGAKGWSGIGGKKGSLVIKVAGKAVEKTIDAANGNNGADPDKIPNALGGAAGEASYYGMSRFSYREWRSKKIIVNLGIFGCKTITLPGIGLWNEEKSPAAYYNIKEFKRLYQGRFRTYRNGDNYSRRYTMNHSMSRLKTVDKEAYRSKNVGKDNSKEQNTAMCPESYIPTKREHKNKIHTQQNYQRLQQKSDHAATLTALKNAKQRHAAALNQLADTIALNENAIVTCDQLITEKNAQLHDLSAAHKKQEDEKALTMQNLAVISQKIDSLDKKISDSIETSSDSYAQQAAAQEKLHEAALTAQCAAIDLEIEKQISIRLTQIYRLLEKQLHVRKTTAEQVYAGSESDKQALILKLDAQTEELNSLKEALESLLKQERERKRNLKKWEAGIVASKEMTVDKATTTHQYDVKVNIDSKSVVQLKSAQRIDMTIPPLMHIETIEISLDELIAVSSVLSQDSNQMRLFIKYNSAYLAQIKKINLNDMGRYWSMLFDFATQANINTSDLNACVLAAHNAFLESIVSSFTDHPDKDELSERRNRYHQLFYPKDAMRQINLIEEIRFRKNCFQYVISTTEESIGDGNRALILLTMPSIHDYPKTESDNLRKTLKEIRDRLLGDDEKGDLDAVYFDICCHILSKKSDRQCRDKNKEYDNALDKDYFHHIQEIIRKLHADFSDNGFSSTHILVRLYSLIQAEYQSLLPGTILEQVEPIANNAQEFAQIFITRIHESQTLCNDPVNLVRSTLSGIQLTSAQCVEMIREINKTELSPLDHLFQQMLIDEIDFFAQDKDDQHINHALKFINDVSALNKIPADFYIDQFRTKTMQAFFDQHKKSCEDDPVFHRTINMIKDAGFVLPIDKQLQHLKSLHLLTAESDQFNTTNELPAQLSVYGNSVLHDMRASLLNELNIVCESDDIKHVYNCIFNKLQINTIEKDKLKSVLHQILLLIKYDDLNKIDLVKLESWSNTCKDELILCGDQDKAIIWHMALHQVDKYLDEHLMILMRKNISDCNALVSLEKKQQADLEKQLKLFRQFIKEGENPDVRDRKKQFLSLLLKKVLKHRKSIEGVNELSALIRVHNEIGFSALKDKILFSDEIYNSLPEDQRNQIHHLFELIKNSKGVEDSGIVFDAWSTLMQYSAHCMMNDEQNPAVIRFFLDSFELLRLVIFETKEQQDALYQWSDEIRKPLLIWYNNAVNKSTEEKQLIEKNILQIERFSDYMRAVAYQNDLTCHVQCLVKDYETSNIAYHQKDALHAVNTVILPHIENIYRMLSCGITNELTRAQLSQQLLDLFSSDLLSTDPEKWLDAISKQCRFAQELILGHEKVDAKLHDKINTLIDAMVSIQSPGLLRKMIAALYDHLLKAELSLDELKVITSKILSQTFSEGLYPGICFEKIIISLANQFQKHLYAHLDKSDAMCADQIRYFSDLEEIVSIDPKLALITYSQFCDKLSDSRFSSVLDSITKQAYGSDQPFSGIFEIEVSKLMDDKPDAICDRKKLAFLSRLTPFLDPAINAIQSIVDKYIHSIGTLNSEQLLTLTALQKMLARQTINHFIKDESTREHLHFYVNRLKDGHLPELQNLIEKIRLAPSDTNDFCSHYRCLNDADNTLFVEHIWTPNELSWVLLLDKKDKKIARNIIQSSPSDEWVLALRSAYWNSVIVEHLFLPLSKEFETSTNAEFQQTLQQFLTNDHVTLAENDLNILIGFKSPHDEFLKEIHACQSQLSSTFSIAKAEKDQNGWLLLVDALVHCKMDAKERFTLTHRILKLSHYYSHFSDLAQIVLKSNEKNVLHHVLYAFLDKAIEKQVIKATHDVIQSIEVLRAEGMNTPLGLDFIELLAKALHSGLGQHSPSVSATQFNRLLTLLMSIKAHEDTVLIADLKKRPLQGWEAVLNRRALAIRLKISSTDENGRQLIEKIIHLQRQYDSDLVNQWIEKLASHTNMLNTEQLLIVFSNFTSKKWCFTDKEAFDKISNQAVDNWQAILDAHFLEKTESVERTPAVIAKDMLDNNTDEMIQDLIRADAHSQSKLQVLIERIQREFNVNSNDSLKTQEQIQEKISEFKKKYHCGGAEFLKNGGSDDELVEFLALMMSAVKLVEDKTIYSTQLTALICYIKGFDSKSFLGNISTGEGKALIARMLAITGALRGERVDLVTSSKALAIPQANEAKKLVELFGFKVCNICDEQCDNSEDERKRRYENNHIFYGDLASFQRDLLLTEYFDTKIRTRQSDRLIVDEVDSMCIDNADKVLYISHEIHDFRHFRMLMAFIWSFVNAPDSAVECAKNIENIEKLCKKKMDEGEIPFPTQLKQFILDHRLNLWIKNAYLAKRMTKGREYSIPEKGENANTVVINDLPTGVEQIHSQWSNGLHQFIQLKESKALTDETLRAIFISNMSYFNRYKSGGRLNGMSGTLGKAGGIERQLLKDIYGADIFTLPRLRTERVIDEKASILGKENEWKKAVVEDVNKKIDNGRAVLIICEDKNAVEAFKDTLQSDPQLKNKKFHIHIYDSLSRADEYNNYVLQPGDIVIATNIAGRGTDLQVEENSALEKADGLHVISTYMYSNERTEIQGKGRTGRKGQKGTTTFCVYEPRHTEGRPVSIEQLQDERDKAEAMRLDDILRIKKPRLEAEHLLLNKYHILQTRIHQVLKESVPDYVVSLQIKSLQNKWTMWLEQHNKLLDDVHKAGNEALFSAFAEFEAKMMTQLSIDEERFVDEPEQLNQLGKCLMAHGNPAGAIRCFDKAIEKEPHFSAFPHYYKAQAILQKSDDKKAAGLELDNAKHEFETMQNRLKSVNEIVQMVNSIRRKSGEGLPPDLFMKTNVSEIEAIQFHINSVMNANGSSISAEQLQGTLSADESKIIYDYLCNHVSHIKNYRVNKNVTIESDEKNNPIFCRDGKKTALPKQYDYCSEVLFELFRNRIGKEKSLAERKLLPSEIGALMITTDDMIAQLGAHLSPINIMTQHKSIHHTEYGHSFWQREEFQGSGFDIKKLLWKEKMAEPAANFEAWLSEKILGVSNWNGIIELLKEKNILVVCDGYSFPKETAAVIKSYRKKIALVDNEQNVIILKETEFEGVFTDKNDILTVSKLLLEKLKAHAIITLSDLQDPALKLSTPMTESTFTKLVMWLHACGVTQNTLHDDLAYKTEKAFHRRTIEEAILLLADKPHFLKSDIGLPEKNEDAIRQLWAFLESNDLVSNPSIDFLNYSDNETKIKAELNNIEDNVCQRIWEAVEKIQRLALTPEQKSARDKQNSGNNEKFTAEEEKYLLEIAKRNQQVTNLCHSINDVLKKSIGSLHTIHRVELKNISLRDFYEGEKLPPIVLEFAQRACADVLNLIEKVDKDKAWRDALTVALIGVAQVVAGAMIIACCPAATQLGRILINEGVGDISFAAQSYISGNFSWKAYREHKLQSLAVSILAAGVSQALSSVPSVQSPMQLSGSAIAKSITEELMKAACTVAMSMATSFIRSNISEQVAHALLENFKKNFKKDVKEKASHLFAEINNSLTQLYKKVGKNRANIIFDEIMKSDELNILKFIHENISAKAISVVTSIASAISGLSKDTKIVNDERVADANSGLNAMIDAAAFIGDCVELADFANKLNDITNTSADFFEKLNALLKSKLASVKKEDNLPELSDGDTKKEVECRLDRASDLVLSQIEAQVVQILTKLGTEKFWLATGRVVKSAQTAVSECVDTFLTKLEVNTAANKTHDYIMASSKENPAQGNKEDWKRTPGLSLKLDELGDDAKQAIHIDDGVVVSADEVRALSGEETPKIVVKDEKVYLDEQDAFSNWRYISEGKLYLKDGANTQSISAGPADDAVCATKSMLEEKGDAQSVKLAKMKLKKETEIALVSKDKTPSKIGQRSVRRSNGSYASKNIPRALMEDFINRSNLKQESLKPSYSVALFSSEGEFSLSGFKCKWGIAAERDLQRNWITGHKVSGKLDCGVPAGPQPLYTGNYGELSAPSISNFSIAGELNGVALKESKFEVRYSMLKQAAKSKPLKMEFFGNRSIYCQGGGEMEFGYANFSFGAKAGAYKTSGKPTTVFPAKGGLGWFKLSEGSVSCKPIGPSLFGHHFESAAQDNLNRAYTYDDSEFGDRIHEAGMQHFFGQIDPWHRGNQAQEGRASAQSSSSAVSKN